MYIYRAVVVHIVDGDTVDVDIDLGFSTWLLKRRIRLKGIDAPESRTKDLTEKIYGLLAKDFVISKMPVGTEVVVETYLDDKDKFGRVSGRIYLYDGLDAAYTEDLSINQQLVENYLAVEYEGQTKEFITEAHLQNREFLKNA